MEFAACGQRRAGLPAIAMLLGLALGLATPAFAADRIYARGLFKDRAILEIDGKQRMLKAGQTSPEGIRLISATSEQAVIDHKGERSTLQLGGRIGGNYAAPRSKSYRILPTANGMFVTTGSVNGYPTRFLVDTGATLVSMNSVQAKRLGIDYRLDGRESRSRTASGISRIWLVQLDRVKVGEIEFTNVAAAVHDGRFPEITLLGMSFLGRLDMTRSAGALLLERKY